MRGVKTKLVAVVDYQALWPERHQAIHHVVGTTRIGPAVRQEAAAAIMHKVPEIARLASEAERFQGGQLIAVQDEFQNDGGGARGCPQNFGIGPLPRLMQAGREVEALAEISERATSRCQVRSERVGCARS